VSEASRDPRIGTLVGGRFRLQRPLGSGGAGNVYEALQEDLGRKVAIKLLRPELADDGETLARFRREARAAAALGHPHIAQVLDFGEPRPGEPAFIAFELVPGVSLADVLTRVERLDVARAVKIARQLLAGLEAAHRAGIVHRDLKPANVFLADVPGVGETAKILDFGIAQVHEGEVFRRLTATGVVIGTPRYMSPEQLSGRTVDARSDLWAIGVLLYRMLAGRLPFDGKTGELLVAIRTQPVPPMPSEAGVPPALEQLVARALKKAPEERWENATMMSQALEGALTARGPTRTRPMKAPSSGEMDRPTMPDPELEGAVRSRAIEAGHESLRPSIDTTKSGVPRPLGPGFYGGVAVLTLGLLVGGIWAAFAWATPGPTAVPSAPPPLDALLAVDAPPPASDAPAEVAAIDPVPATGTVASYVVRAQSHVSSGGPARVTAVRAVVDRSTGLLDFERTDVATTFDADLTAPDGRCIHYTIAADRFEHAVARGTCGAPLPVPHPDVGAVLARAAEDCPRLFGDRAPVVVDIHASEGGSAVSVHDLGGQLLFEATSDAWATVTVNSCPGTRHRTPAMDSDGVINPWGDPVPEPPAPETERRDPPRGSTHEGGAIDPWGP
jgi:serine/threonine-protein kinase